MDGSSGDGHLVPASTAGGDALSVEAPHNLGNAHTLGLEFRAATKLADTLDDALLLGAGDSEA